MEGTACYGPPSGCQTGSLVLPIMEYSHGDGCSITGGYRYRGTAIPALHGAYVFGDFCSKKIWLGVQSPSGNWTRADLLATNLSISTFGEDATGEVYVAALEGAVYRLVRVPYGATYQASTFAIASGATLTVPVTVTNTGSLPWDANSAFRLAYHWYQGSTLVTWDGLRTILPSSVPPAEASPSRPPSRLRPRPAPTPSSGTWSGSSSPGSPARAWLRRPSPSLSPPAPTRPYGATYQASTFAIASGATLTVPVTVTNTGSLTWDANSAFRLAYHWYQGSTLVTWDGLRTILPSSVPPGGSLTLQASVKAPASAGTYTLKWDMVRESVTWFSGQGVAPAAIPITVASSSDSSLRRHLPGFHLRHRLRRHPHGPRHRHQHRLPHLGRQQRLPPRLPLVPGLHPRHLGLGCARSSPPPFPPAEASPSRPPSRLRPRPAPTPSSGTWSGSSSPGSPARAWPRRTCPSSCLDLAADRGTHPDRWGQDPSALS